MKDDPQRGANHAGPSRRRAVELLGAAVGISLLEALAYLVGGAFEWLAARLWLLTGFGFLCLAALHIGRALLEDVRRRRILPLLLLCAAVGFSMWGITGVEHVGLHHDPTQQIARGLDSFKQPGWNYTDWGFLSYPNRQYLIAAIPSVFFGREITTLRLGYALTFLVGILLFWTGTRQLWLDLPHGVHLSAIMALAVFAFPYAVQYLRTYEQAIIPLSATLAAAGWLMVTALSPTIPNLIGLSWIGAFLGCSYTPSLGSWVLLNIALVWLSGRELHQRRKAAALSWIAVLVVAVSFGLLSFLSRGDVFHGANHGVKPDFASSVTQAFLIFFAGEPRVYIPAVLYFPIAVALLVGVAGRLGAAGFVTSWWIIAVIAAANSMVGYGTPTPDLTMQRTLIIVPPLLLLSSTLGLKFLGLLKDRLLGNSLVAAIALLVTVQGVWNLATLDKAYQPGLLEIVYSDMLDQARLMGADVEAPVVIVLLSRRGEFRNAEDYLKYFFPRHAIERSVMRASSLSPSGVPTLAYMDTALWEPDVFPWADLDVAETIEYERIDGRYYKSHQMYRWVIWPSEPLEHR